MSRPTFGHGEHPLDGNDLRAIVMLVIAALLGTGVIVWGAGMFILVRWMVGA